MRYGADNTSDVVSWELSIKNILFALLVCSLIFLGEKTVVQLISISYHRKQFDAKIKESKRNVYLVGLLFEASRNMFPVYCREFAEDDSIIFDPLTAQVGDAKRANRHNSLMPLRMVRNVGRQVGQNVGRIGDKVTSAFGNVASELTGKQVFNPTATRSIVVQSLERKRCAEALARRIWMSFVVEGREALYLEDIVEVLGNGHEAEAEECFAALDKDSNGDISLDEMILSVTEFGRMRKSLNHSMHDVDQAIHVLDNLLLSVAFIVGVLVFISFVTSGFGTVIAAGATTLLSLSFVFMATAQEVLGSCIFLFVKHPFDIGDRVDVGDKSYVVERISLLFTVFRNIDDHRMTQVPNNILNTLWIDNFTRANAMHERLTVPVSFDTTFAEIQALRDEMELFVRDKDNSRDFQPDVDIEVVGVGDLDKLELRVDIRHKSNWSNETVRAARRSKFMCALVLAMRKVPIRAPGAAAEEKKDGDDGGDGDDKGDKAGPAPAPAAAPAAAPTSGDHKSTQAGGSDPKDDENPDATAAAAAAGTVDSEHLAPDTAQASGIDNNKRASGTLSQRGSTAIQREAAIADRLNSRPPATDIARDDRDTGLYRTTTGSSTNNGRPLSSHIGQTGGNTVSRGLSGHRKAGTHVSYHEDPAAPPMPSLNSAQAGITPSSSTVPILHNPKPGSRSSARYEPPSQTGPNNNNNQQQALNLPIIGSPEPDNYHPYYNQDNTYDPAPPGAGAGTFANEPSNTSAHRRSGSAVPVSGVTASTQYEQAQDRYDPVSPPSAFSPPQSHPQAPAPAATAPPPPPPQHAQDNANPADQRASLLARTLKKGRGARPQSSPYAEHEA